MRTNPRAWYQFKAEADASVVDIHIVDFIGDWIDDYWGFGVTARAFLEQLAALPDSVTTIRVHINSPGGDVFAAANIANALRDQQRTKGRTVETIVDGLAASAASVVMMAGSKVTMADNALMMIHDPWTCACGNAAELGKIVETLNTVRDSIVAVYQWHATIPAEEIVAKMAATTWLTADEAIAAGFATDKVVGLKVAASLDARSLKGLDVPEPFRARVAAWTRQEPPAPVPAPAADVVRDCAAAGCADLAEGLIRAGAPAADVAARLAEASAVRAAATARATEIRAVCLAAKMADLADGYIAGAMPVEAVRAHLTTLTARIDTVEIDAGLRPTPPRTKAINLDPAAIYAARNAKAS